MLVIIQQEAQVCSDLWVFMLAFMKHNAMSDSHNSDSFPGVLALLVSGDAGVQQAGLEAAEKAWRTIEAAERHAIRSGAVRKLLRGCPFIEWTYVRESLLRLRQWHFKYLEPQVLADTMCLFGGWGQTLVSENGFNRVKDHQRDNKNLVMSRTKRFIWPPQAKLIERIYKRDELKSSAQDRPAPQCRNSLKNALYDSQSQNTSLEEDQTRGIMDHAKWLSPTPTGAHAIPACWQFLQWCEQHDGWDRAGDCWKAT